MANAVTMFRIAAGFILLFTRVFSPAFYALYIAGGLSDMLDGFVARKTNTRSEFGAKLDSAADFVFMAASLMKLLPVLDIPAWLYVWTGIIAFIKLVNLISGFVLLGTFAAVHSLMNKAAGALLFVLPLTISFVPVGCSLIVVCFTATFAAIQEGYYIRTGKTDDIHSTTAVNCTIESI